MSNPTRSVAIVQKSLPEYRAPLFDALRDKLAGESVQLRLLVGEPTGGEALRRDSGALSWAEHRVNTTIGLADRGLIWQPVLDAAQCDLVVVEQSAKLAANYVLLALQAAGRARVAFWGHGANLQRHSAHATAEAVKRVVSRWPHWWFAYTEGSRDRVRALGYPEERITVVQNAVDTTALRMWRSRLDDTSIAATRAELDLGAGPVAAMVGGLYTEKRLPFLVEAADVIHSMLPDFRLLVIGDGPARGELEQLAAARPYVRVLGAQLGADKVRLLAPASLLLLPGLVGLALVDAFALQLPLVTTAVDFHSPEIEYLQPDVNGVLVDPVDDPQLYARAVVSLLQDRPRLENLRKGCRVAAERYTLETMVERFAAGVLRALSAASRSRGILRR